MKTKIILIFSFLLFIVGCSSSEETTNTEETESQPEIYVFDDVTEPDDTSGTEILPPPQTETNENITQYFVQVGAFTSQERADQFLKENSSKTKYQLDVTYSQNVQLFVVRLPAFSTKTEAEKVRNEFWKSGLFNDAFIVTQ